MSAARLLGSAYPVLLLVALLVVAVVGGVRAVRKERKDPSSYTRQRRSDDLAWWGLLPAEEQEDVDTAALDLGEQAEIDARQGGPESAEFLAHRAQVNSLFHP